MTRVLIVDDHPVFRDGLAGLLATLPEVEIVGSAGTAEEALTALRENAPDIVLMDINCPAPPVSRRRDGQPRSRRPPPYSS